MIEVIGVRFKKVGKIYYFSPGDRQIPVGTHVVVETSRCIECGQVAITNRDVEEDLVVKPLKKVIRIATPEDLKQMEKNKAKEAEAQKVCLAKIKEHKMDMKLIDVEYTFDGSKVLFYFTADGRVDFRNLVKDLASVFRTRIELRQIGVRDEAKMLGGIGVCGKACCCATFLGEFQPVSIKMAKDQGLSLNPTKISGTCGRLMCCLKYEQEAYEDLLKRTPKVGAFVSTPDGKGNVTEVNLLTGMLKINLEKSPDTAPRIFNKKQVKLIRDGAVKLTAAEIKELKGLE